MSSDRRSPHRWIGLVLIVVLASSCGEAGDGPGMELVAHVTYQMGGDIQFQRRSGAHTIDGVSVDTTTDLVFASAHTDVSRVDGGIEIIDITDATNPTRLTRIPCPGYQSDVAVYETLLVQTLDHPGSNAGCDPEWLRTTGSAAVDRSGTGGVRIFGGRAASVGPHATRRRASHEDAARRLLIRRREPDGADRGSRLELPH